MYITLGKWALKQEIALVVSQVYKAGDGESFAYILHV